MKNHKHSGASRNNQGVIDVSCNITQALPFEIRKYINSNYDIGTLSNQGRSVLQNQRV